MGNFSVSCGVTRLSITSGDKCVLIPIAARQEYQSEQGLTGLRHYAKCNTTHLFHRNDVLWQPYLLPIRGVYDDYGGITDIVRDENTAAIERCYSMDIDDFLSIITDGRRSPYDEFSAFFDKFFMYREEYKADDYWGIFDKIFGKEDGIYQLGNFAVTADRPRNKFITFRIGGDSKSKTYDIEDILCFLDDYFWETGCMPAVNDTDKCYELMCIGGMFVLEEVYDQFAKLRLPEDKKPIYTQTVDPSFLIDNGFVVKENKANGLTFKYVKDVNGIEVAYNATTMILNDMKARAYYIGDFCNMYKKITGEKLDLSRFDGMDSFEIRKYYLTNFVIALCMENIQKDFGANGEYPVLDNENLNKWIEKNPLSFAVCKLKDMCGLFQSYDIMKNVYMSEILQGRCIDQYTEMARFCFSINLLNVIWVPSFCATQDGCIEAEMKLQYIINKIVDERACKLVEKGVKLPDVKSSFGERFY